VLHFIGYIENLIYPAPGVKAQGMRKLFDVNESNMFGREADNT